MPVHYVEQLLGSPVGSCVSHTEHLDSREQQLISLRKRHDFRPAASGVVGGPSSLLTPQRPRVFRARFLHLGM